MVNPKILEEAFSEFTSNLSKWIPDGIIQVDLKLLDELGLLDSSHWEDSAEDSQLTQYFHIVETPDKVTLFNEQFAIWIVPQLIDENPTTTTFISLVQGNKAHLELVYMTSGVYNTPKYILKILQHFLTDVQDTEKAIASLGK